MQNPQIVTPIPAQGIGAGVKATNQYDANDTITWSQISEPAYVSDDEEKKRDAEPKGPCTSKKIKCYICLFVTLIIIVALIVLRSVFTDKFLDWLLENVQNLGQSETFGAYAFFIGMQFAFSWLLLPGLSYFNIIQSFAMQNFLKAWLIATFGSWCAAVILFIIIKTCFKKSLTKKFKNNSLYKVLSSEIKENPWKTSTFVNILFIPTAFKNYTLPLTDLTLIQYMIPSLPFYMFFSAMLTLIGSQLSGFSDAEGNKSWSEKTTAEKFNQIVSLALTISTIIIVCILGKIARKKMA